MDLDKEMEGLIARCKADYEAHIDDPFYSNVLHSQWEELNQLARRLRESGPENLLCQLREERPELEADFEREVDHPSFDWYDEHYHAKRLQGELDARKSVERLLEELV